MVDMFGPVGLRPFDMQPHGTVSLAVDILTVVTVAAFAVLAYAVVAYTRRDSNPWPKGFAALAIAATMVTVAAPTVFEWNPPPPWLVDARNTAAVASALSVAWVIRRVHRRCIVHQAEVRRIIERNGR